MSSFILRELSFIVTMNTALQDKVTEELPMPALFQFLTLLAFKIFTNEKVSS